MLAQMLQGVSELREALEDCLVQRRNSRRFRCVTSDLSQSALVENTFIAGEACEPARTPDDDWNQNMVCSVMSNGLSSRARMKHFK
jgi:hypothetical protein